MYQSREFKKVEFSASSEHELVDKLRFQYGLEWNAFGAGWRGHYGSMAVTSFDRDTRKWKAVVYVNPDQEMRH